MSRELYQRHEELVTEPLPIADGGTNANTPPSALVSLGAVSAALVGQPNGITPLDGNGQIPIQFLPPADVNSVSVSGPKQLNVSGVGEYQITDFDFYQLYTLSCSTGTVSRVHDVITYTAPNTGGTHGFTLNGVNYVVTIKDPYIVTPSILSPVNNATDVSLRATFSASAPATIGLQDTVIASHWELDYGKLADTVTITTGDKSIFSPVNPLPANFTYTLRMRYEFSVLGLSAWSEPITFTTTAGNALATLNTQIIYEHDGPSSSNFGCIFKHTENGDLLVIGDRYNSKAEVYFRNAGVYEYQTTLYADFFPGIDIAMSAFPSSIAISEIDNTIYIGDIGVSEGGGGALRCGGVFIFRPSTPGDLTSYICTGAFKAPTPVNYQAFGSELLLNHMASRLFVSCSNPSADNVSASNSGIFIFNPTVGLPDFVKHITNPEGNNNSKFGEYIGSIATDQMGTRLIVGAKQFSISNGRWNGRVYIYDFNGTEWTLSEMLDPDQVDDDELFGLIITLSGSGDVIAVGNFHTGAVDINSSLYIFKRINNIWSRVTRIDNNEWNSGSGASYLGDTPTSLCLNYDGSLLIAGFGWLSTPANAANISPNWGDGYTYAYSDNIGQWELAHKYSPLSESEFYGTCVSIPAVDNTIFISAENKTHFSKTGAVYIYN